MPKDDERLQNIVASSGLTSRRGAALLIKNGEICVNNIPSREPGLRVTLQDKITYHGNLIKPTKKFLYIALNKPQKYLCSNTPHAHYPLALDILAREFPQKLFSVGRLDYMSSGLIFFTNDGDFAQKVSHPSFQMEKEYLVTTKEPMTKEVLESFVKGRRLGGTLYKIQSYKMFGVDKVSIVLAEGKNREIRHLFGSARLDIKRLHRTRIGKVRLNHLPKGSYRLLKKDEKDSLLKDGP